MTNPSSHPHTYTFMYDTSTHSCSDNWSIHTHILWCMIQEITHAVIVGPRHAHIYWHRIHTCTNTLIIGPDTHPYIEKYHRHRHTFTLDTDQCSCSECWIQTRIYTVMLIPDTNTHIIHWSGYVRLHSWLTQTPNYLLTFETNTIYFFTRDQNDVQYKIYTTYSFNPDQQAVRHQTHTIYSFGHGQHDVRYQTYTTHSFNHDQHVVRHQINIVFI